MKEVFGFVNAYSGLAFVGCGIVALLTLIGADSIYSSLPAVSTVFAGAVVLMVLSGVSKKLVMYMLLAMMWMWVVIYVPQAMGVEPTLFWDSLLSYVAVAPLLVFGLVLTLKQESANASKI